jgi:hypothetical protein
MGRILILSERGKMYTPLCLYSCTRSLIEALVAVPGQALRLQAALGGVCRRARTDLE